MTQGNSALVQACKKLLANMDPNSPAVNIIEGVVDTLLKRIEPIVQRDQIRFATGLSQICDETKNLGEPSERLLESLEEAIMCFGNYAQGQCKLVHNMIDGLVAKFAELDTRVVA